MGRTKTKPQQELTARQEQVKQLIAEFSAKNGFPPTYAEIGKRLKVRPSAVSMHVLALVRKGHLSRVPGAARSLVVQN